MGGGRETSTDRDTSGRGERITIYPSEIHEYAYCPRLYFFHINLPRERSMREKLRLLLGRIFHLVKSVPDRLRGMRVEEVNEATVGRIRLRGRPDSYTMEDGVLRVVERKSGRKPLRGAWISDVMQATAYTLILSRGSAREAILEIQYRDGVRVLKVNDDMINNLVRILDEIALVKAHGIVPAALRGERKCSICPYREECWGMDEGLDYELYEPGHWLSRRRVL